MKWTVTALIVAVLFGTGRQAVAAETPLDTDWADHLEDNARAAFAWGDFDELADLYDRAGRAGSSDSRGNAPLDLFMYGLNVQFNIAAPVATDAYYANLDALTEVWLNDHPTSNLALALRLRALHARAWWYRGGGYHDTVSPQQWTLFSRYIESAIAVAKAHGISSDDVLTHTYLVMIARSANVDAKRQRMLVREVLDKHPEAMSIWHELAFSNQPKWGGDWDAVDHLIRDAASRQRTADQGHMVYAQLWLDAYFGLEGSYFQSPVEWMRLRHGLDLILSAHPQSKVVNDYAKLACLRGDRTAAEAMMGRIGDHPDLSHWGSGTAARSAFDQCRRWLNDTDGALPTKPVSPPPAPGKVS